MKKPEKLKISRAEQEYNENWCRRCDKYYCLECVEFYEVTFDIEENVYADRPDLTPHMETLKGEKVCPWCYNQLIDIHNSALLRREQEGKR